MTGQMGSCQRYGWLRFGPRCRPRCRLEKGIPKRAPNFDHANLVRYAIPLALVGFWVTMTIADKSSPKKTDPYPFLAGNLRVKADELLGIPTLSKRLREVKWPSRPEHLGTSKRPAKEMSFQWDRSASIDFPRGPRLFLALGSN